MAKAAASSDFIKQVTAAEAESQGAAAHSSCCPPSSSSPSPLEAHTLSGQWAGAAAGAVLKVPETKKEVMVKRAELLKLYGPQVLAQVEHCINQSWSAKTETPPLPLTHQAWSEYWGFNNRVSRLRRPLRRSRKMCSTLTLFYEPPWVAEMVTMRTTETSRATDTDSQEAAIHRSCWLPLRSSTSSQMEAHVPSRQQVGLAVWALLSAPATEAEALAKREKGWEDNRDQELSQEEDSTDENRSTEEESLPMPVPQEAWEEHWDSQLDTPTSTELDLPRCVHNRPSYELHLLSCLDKDMDHEGDDMWDMRERIASKETTFWEEELKAWNRKSFQRILHRSSPTAVPRQEASLFRRALGALRRLFQCPCITARPEL